MKITLTGSLGNIGKPLTQQLIREGHDVTVISSSPDKVEQIEALGAKAAIGSVSDTAFLARTFENSDAVFAMTPPNFGGSNIIENTTNAGKAMATAITEAGVKRVVMLSSVGGDLPSGNGPIAALYNIEQHYETLSNVSVTYLRAGYFYLNFLSNVPLIKNAGIMGGNYPSTAKLPLVHPRDIAVVAAEELQKKSKGKNVVYVISDVCKPAEIVQIFGEAIGKPNLPWVQFTDDQSLQGMIQAGLPEEIAGLYTEMGIGLANGSIASDFEKSGSNVVGKTKLKDFAKEFASNF